MGFCLQMQDIMAIQQPKLQMEQLQPIKDLLSNDVVDLDCPNPVNYPRGMLLFNTRRSGNNVKEYKRNYFNSTDFAG